MVQWGIFNTIRVILQESKHVELKKTLTSILLQVFLIIIISVFSAIGRESLKSYPACLSIDRGSPKVGGQVSGSPNTLSLPLHGIDHTI